jgi:serine/threonine protein kinase
LDEASVSSALFHEAFSVWNSPAAYQIQSWISIGDRHWALEKMIAQGDISDVYTARLARWPTELAVVKLLRDGQAGEQFDREWDALQTLHNSKAPGVYTFSLLLPQPILHGSITGGAFAGRRASIYRWASGFYHTFEDVMQAYPGGIPARDSIWIWRRILEVLSFIHTSGMAHGAVVPAHLLVQENEHGVRLVGYSLAGRLNEKLRAAAPGTEAFYPKPAQAWSTLTPQLDLVMSARCIAAILGGDPQTAALPSSVPARLANLVQRVALAKPGSEKIEGPWTLRELLGEIATEVYGPPQFIPIVMPG